MSRRRRDRDRKPKAAPPAAPAPPPPPAAPELPSRSDIALIGRAVKDRWPIPEPKRAEIAATLIAVVEAGESERSRIAAAKVLQAMDRDNMEQEKRDQAIPDRSEMRIVVEYVDSPIGPAPAAPGTG